MPGGSWKRFSDVGTFGDLGRPLRRPAEHGRTAERVAVRTFSAALGRTLPSKQAHAYLVSGEGTSSVLPLIIRRANPEATLMGNQCSSSGN
jgi:hypothetical protein